MTPTTLIVDPELTILMSFAGLMFGLLYFAAVKRSVVLLVGRRGWLGPLALTLVRIGAAAGFLSAAANLGPACLMAAFMGFLVARVRTLRFERSAG